MKQIVILSFILYFFSINNTYSQEGWILAGTNTNSKETYYINSTYISNENQLIKVWTKTVIEKVVMVSKGKSKIKKIITSEKKVLWEFDCENQKLMLHYGITYDNLGNASKTYSPADYEKEWVVMVPGSVGEALLNKACELYNF